MSSASPLLPVPVMGHRLAWPALPPTFDSLSLARQKSAASQPYVVVTASSQDAQRLFDEISWVAPKLKVLLLPDWETLPYDIFSPHQDLISDRLSTLHTLLNGKWDVLLLSTTSALHFMAPPPYVAGQAFHLSEKQKLPRDEFLAQMKLASYLQVQQVQTSGEFALRGGLVDLFPTGSALPYRIELDDETIVSLRAFNVDSQRTLYPVPEICLLPRREYPLDSTGRATFRSRFRELFEGDPTRSTLYRDVSDGLPAAGLEYYLPLFFETCATIFDYLPQNIILVLLGPVAAEIQHFWHETQQRYRLLNGDKTRPILPPKSLFLSEENFFALADKFACITLSTADKTSSLCLPNLAVERKNSEPLTHLKSFITNFSGRVLLVADSAGREVTLTQMLDDHHLSPTRVSDFQGFEDCDASFALTHGPLSGGFQTEGLALITETELYGSTTGTRRRGKIENLEGLLRDLSELQQGQLVVHAQYGIGRYQGLKCMDLGGGQTEFLHLLYAEDESLYVPVSSLQFIQRYSGGDPENASLSRLGSGQWDKLKEKARMRARDSAAELLSLYAERAKQTGHAFTIDTKAMERFVQGFEFEETHDQLSTINSVLSDMASAKPMDRLICGDVGFGKTEVALRAAFVAAHGGRQVAMLTPTTLLVEQHLHTFQDRFADFNLKVAGMSRLTDSAAQKRIVQNLANGSVDIVISTHRLLQPDIRFARLGLVILDEEHRFGVHQKEALKHLCAQVDVLTLTATPIPRTLGMAMEGLRDVSIIATPPQRRLSVKTMVMPYEQGMVREACLREFNRGGQVYFLYNEVARLPQMEKTLAELLPEARIAVAHGQMPERALERVMRDFTQRHFNLLLCSTIIETGLDIPSANTILIHRADKFGLAQLHQLRGRVGRSHHQAFAYLFTPPGVKLPARAQQRLEAIAQMEELGSGFFLAMQDLEIRGAGEVLGEAQSGAIEEVGYQMYSDLLKRAIASLKDPASVQEEVDMTVDLRDPMLLPEEYVPDVHERLVLYKRLAHTTTLDALQQLKEELTDRFGTLPAPAQLLLSSQKLKIKLRSLGVKRIHISAKTIQIQFVANPPIKLETVMALVRRTSGLTLKQDGLIWQKICEDGERYVQALEDLLIPLIPSTTKSASKNKSQHHHA